jgi:hypothetical protein
MTDDERFDRLATAIERVADVVTQLGGRVDQVAQAQLATQQQIGFLSTEMLQLSQQQSAMQQQQTFILQRQAEQDQRFDILLGEIRHIVQRLDGGSKS